MDRITQVWPSPTRTIFIPSTPTPTAAAIDPIVYINNTRMTILILMAIISLTWTYLGHLHNEDVKAMRHEIRSLDQKLHSVDAALQLQIDAVAREQTTQKTHQRVILATLLSQSKQVDRVVGENMGCQCQGACAEECAQKVEREQRIKTLEALIRRP